MHMTQTYTGKGTRMKRFAVLMVATMLLVATTAGVAFATDPTGAANPFTFTESNPDNGAIGAPSAPALAGASAWTYSDAADATDKTEGSYRAFDDVSADGTYTVNPHGGYSTTSNKCSTCHAVHRATGAFTLMRVDNPDDACNYCHIGSHRHAASEAYFGGTGGIYSSNGHTIGAGKEIPDSSVWQWTEDVTLNGADGASETFPVRRYMSEKNEIQRYIVHGDRFIRLGSNYLRCASCHSVHNATRQIWKPAWSGYGPAGGAAVAGDEMTTGYKLLRNSPSGGIQVNPADINGDGTLNTASANARVRSRLDASYYDPGAGGVPGLDGLANNKVDYRITTVETTRGIDPATGLEATTGDALMGSNITGYTPWMYFAPTNVVGTTPTAMKVYETSMAFWCADCHNLNIAGKQLAPGFGSGRSGQAMLADRSHAVPNQLRTSTTAEAGAQCYSCHNSDMPLDAGNGDGCGGCHIGPRMYHAYKNEGTFANGTTWVQRIAAVGATYTATSDFPHSGPDSSMKLLNARDRIAATGSRYTVDEFGKAFNTATDGVDKVCKQCHGPYKDREIGYDK